MLATALSATVIGVEGRVVSVEAHIGRGLPSFALVGLPDAACREVRDRVRAAVSSSGLAFPNRRLTVNLAPSSVPKSGAGTDLAVALAILSAAGDASIPDRTAFIGELSLAGEIRRVAGVLPMVAALRGRADAVVVPLDCLGEASVVPGIDVRGAANLGDLLAQLRGDKPWPPVPADGLAGDAPSGSDLVDVRGQASARAALEIAAAGGHHLLLIGPPGAGKTMLAARLPGLLPALGPDDALDVTSIHSAAGAVVDGLIRRPPFRAPHHTSSAISLIGGGAAAMRPGEVTLAHRGVLFLDELGEFSAVVLDALRQPLEDGVVRVSRARGSVTYPARFVLVAATNPCPCGAGGTACRCSEASRQRYARRLSGPLLDRFDLRVHVGPVPPAELVRNGPSGESTDVVAARVAAARQRALDRQRVLNAELDRPALDRVAPLGPAAGRILERAVGAGTLTGRGVQRIRRVVATMADLAGEDRRAEPDRFALALTLRPELGLLDPAA